MRHSVVALSIFVVVLVITGVSGGPDDPNADPTAGATYIGVKACKKCHFKQHRTWKKTKHAKAWDTLPEKYRSADQKDEDGRICVSCHVTGWGEQDRGGFQDPAQSENLLGVTCEACHGPGSKHGEVGKKVMDEKRKFAEGEKTFIRPTTTRCSECHNPHVSHAKYAKEK